MKQKILTVSVIITTKNEEAVIASCLRSITKETYTHIETIVVDNNSSDHTKEVARSFSARVFDKGPERSAQRNFGAQKAKGEYVLFLDADMELTPTVIEECVNVIEQKTINNKQKNKKCLLFSDYCPKVIALVIPEESFGIGFWAKCKTLERSYYLNVPWIESARFFERKAFQKTGGYDETLTGPEDFELAQRVKHLFGDDAVGRIDAFIRHNEGKLSLRKTIRKKYYYGKNMQEYRKRSSAKGYFGKQSSVWERYGLFFSRPSIVFGHPLLFIGMIIMKTLEMGAIAMGAMGF